MPSKSGSAKDKPKKRPPSAPKAAPKQDYARSRVVVRILGAVFAVVMAFKLDPAGKMSARLPSMETSQLQMQQALDEVGVSFDKLRDYLPAMGRLMEREEPDVHPKLTRETLHAKHPVVILPGMTNTPLDVYKGQSCAAGWIRKRLWGSLSATTRLFTSNNSCFLDHMELDEVTGLDPPDRMVRAAQDLASVEVVFGLEMWKHVVDELVLMGYNPNNMAAFPYDWRLAPMDLERRDMLLSRLRDHIELVVRFHGEKVALFSHSYGGNIVQHFMSWVEAGSGEGWMEKHIAVLGHIGVPLLGVAKSVPALLSGETKDTVGFGGLAVRMGDMMMPRKQRLRVVRSFGCIIVMLPKGGNLVWGSLNGEKDGDALDDCRYQRSSGDIDRNENSSLPHGAFLSISRNGSVEQLDVEAASRLLLEKVPPAVKERIRKQGALRAGVEGFTGQSEEYADAFDTPLPYAPSMRVLCLYGVDNPTERRYFYRDSEDAADSLGTDLTLDTDIDDESRCIGKGISNCNGDATVPLVSLGLMCRKWVHNKRLNPAGIKVTTVEFPHTVTQALRFDLRGGPQASDHLDIMLNEAMIKTMSRAVSGAVDEIQDSIVSNIDAIEKVIQMPGDGTLPQTSSDSAARQSRASDDREAKHDEL